VKDVKEAKKQKKVSFADPIAMELKPPKRAQPDDSIFLIKAIEPGTEHTSGISKDLTMMEAAKMQQALAVTLKLMERTLVATRDDLVCPQSTQPVPTPGTTVLDSGVVHVDNTGTHLAVELVEQNIENNTTTQELVLVADTGILGGSQEAQVVIDETVQGTHADVLGEDLLVAQASSPIELESEHPAITTGEGRQTPSQLQRVDTALAWLEVKPHHIRW
jgi:hypothetical protein